MKKEFDYFSIEYNECDNSYIDNIENIFIKKSQEIMKFFKLRKLQKFVHIKIWNSVDEFNKNVKCSGDWVTGRSTYVEDKYRIDILTYNCILKRQGHGNETVDYMPNLLLHEFVHICHMEKIGFIPSLMWLREGLAVTISGQYEGRKLIFNCTMEEFLEGRINYINFYTVSMFILKKYGDDYFLSLALDEEFAKNQSEKLYNETRNWMLKK